MSAKRSSELTPWCLFGFFLGIQKEARRPQAAKSPAKLPKETRRNTMIHLYCGDGKGKTTAAMGLALRMAGRHKQVMIAQFFKRGRHRGAQGFGAASQCDPASGA